MKSFVLQKNQSDCGIACLSSIIQYYGGKPNQEKLRIASGTNAQGTTLLGLYQTALSIGFEAEGMQADINYLRNIKRPVILHAIVNNTMQHFLVCYKVKGGRFLIGDPALGIKWITEEELALLWKSNKLLQLEPNETQFVKNRKEQHLQWKWFLHLVSKDSSILTTILIIGIAVAILSLATAVFAQVLIDKLIPSGDSVRIYFAIGLVALLLISKSLIGYFRQMLMLKQGVDTNVRITKNFFSGLLLIPMPFFASRKIGDIVARLNDIGRIQQTVAYLFGELLISILILIISLAAVFMYNQWVGLVLLAGIPLFAFIAYVYHRAIVIGQREAMVANALNESNFINTINNILPVKSFGRESRFAKLGLVTFRFLQEKLYHLGKVGSAVQLFAGLAGIIVTIAVVVISTSQMMAGKMTTGEFMAVFSLSGTVLPALASIAFANIQLQGARIAFERMYEFSSMDKEYNAEVDDQKEKATSFEILQLHAVNFRYPGRRLLLEEVNFSVSKGELVTIFGDNGTGKSTLLSLIQQFNQPESGIITFNGNNVNCYSINSYRKLVAVVPQDVTLINGTLLANIVMSDSEDDLHQAIKVLSKHQLIPFFENFPQGFQTMLGDGGIQISGGQKQLVGLARALVVSPKLLLIDELTAYMDLRAEQFVMELLLRLKSEMGILSITHNIRNAALSDRIVVLSNGKVEATGKHHELITGNNLYSTAWKAFATFQNA
ncbi:peptidase domain-containing ABC transporter [Williamwhitmania taraxaci]|nr:peptidase domain-containing ABC transporter [Williamwhitmania taraxaci]